MRKNVKYLYITTIVSGKKCILEKLSTLSFGLYYTSISIIETNVTINQKFTDQNIFTVWHNWLGHPGSTMIQKIIENSYGHPLKN